MLEKLLPLVPVYSLYKIDVVLPILQNCFEVQMACKKSTNVKKDAWGMGGYIHESLLEILRRLTYNLLENPGRYP